jgi:hypothetical protein
MMVYVKRASEASVVLSRISVARVGYFGGSLQMICGEFNGAERWRWGDVSDGGVCDGWVPSCLYTANSEHEAVD